MIGLFGILSFGMGTVTFVYAAIGLMGFLTYGNDIQSSITSNLPNEKFYF